MLLLLQEQFNCWQKKLNSAGLMSDNDCDDITAVKAWWNDRERATLIVKILRNKVRTNLVYFNDFIAVLRSDPVFSDILGVLETKGKQ